MFVRSISVDLKDKYRNLVRKEKLRRSNVATVRVVDHTLHPVDTSPVHAQDGSVEVDHPITAPSTGASGHGT